MSKPTVTPEVLKANMEKNESTLEEVLTLLDSKDFKVYKQDKEKNFTIYTGKYPGSSFIVVKSTIIFTGNHDKLVKINDEIPDIDDKTPKEEADGLLSQYSFGNTENNETAFIYYIVDSGSSMVSHRDFLVFRRTYERDGKKIWLSTNAIGGDELVPHVKGIVRGAMTFQANILEKNPNGDGELYSFIVHADPCGRIPAMVYNSVCYDQGYTALNQAERAK